MTVQFDEVERGEGRGEMGDGDVTQLGGAPL